jgi:hypothetical protein
MATLKSFGLALAGVLIMGWNSNAYSTESASDDSNAGAALRIIDGRPVVDGVMVNGHGPYRFLVDTGSNVDLIEAGLAASIGLETNYRNELSSAAGSTPVVGSAENTIQLGSTVANRQLFIFSDLQSLHHLSPEIRGVLGQVFLSRFDYVLDLRNKRMEFGKRDWQGNRSAFKMVNARPAVSTSSGWLVLDSGAPAVVLFGVKAGNVNQSLRTLSGSVDTGSVQTRLFMADNLVWRGDAIAVPRQAKETGDGLLPVHIFKTIYVCNSESYIGFER